MLNFSNALRKYCKVLGKDIVSHLPKLLEIFSELDRAEIDIFDAEIFKTFEIVFELVEEDNLRPFYSELTEQIKRYLLEYEAASLSPSELAVAIGENKFMRFFIDIAISILEDKSDNDFVAADLYSLFGNMLCVEKSGNFPKIVSELLASVQMLEKPANRNKHSIRAEKKKATESLRLFAITTGIAFEPHVQPCFDAVYDQLTHPSIVIRRASIKALIEFNLLTFQLNKIECAKEMTAKIFPKFASILKMDSAPSIAINIFKAYGKLMNESVIIFDGKMQLFNEIFNCVNDVMGAKVICQANTDFVDNRNLIEAANNTFLKLGNVTQSFEFAVYFSSIFPVLHEKLENTTQKQTKNSKSFRISVYRTLTKSILVLKAYTSTSFDVLFPLLLSGMKDECHKTRKEAVNGFCEFLLHAGEKSNTKSEQISRELSKLLANEIHAAVVDAACVAIGRLMTESRPLISVEQFLPHIVEKLKNGQIYMDVFKCFHVLLNQQNKVLLTMLYPVILTGLREISSTHTDDGVYFS